VKPAQEALHQVAEEDGDHWIVQLLIDQVDETDYEDQNVIVELHVEGTLIYRVVRVFVWHQVERYIGFISGELEG